MSLFVVIAVVLGIIGVVLLVVFKIMHVSQGHKLKRRKGTSVMGYDESPFEFIKEKRARAEYLNNYGYSNLINKKIIHRKKEWVVNRIKKNNTHGIYAVLERVDEKGEIWSLQLSIDILIRKLKEQNAN